MNKNSPKSILFTTNNFVTISNRSCSMEEFQSDNTAVSIRQKLELCSNDKWSLIKQPSEKIGAANMRIARSLSLSNLVTGNFHLNKNTKHDNEDRIIAASDADKIKDRKQNIHSPIHGGKQTTSVHNKMQAKSSSQINDKLPLFDETDFLNQHTPKAKNSKLTSQSINLTKNIQSSRNSTNIKINDEMNNKSKSCTSIRDSTSRKNPPFDNNHNFTFSSSTQLPLVNSSAHSRTSSITTQRSVGAAHIRIAQRLALSKSRNPLKLVSPVIDEDNAHETQRLRRISISQRSPSQIPRNLTFIN